MTGYIYIHTNKINGKKYVGQTTENPERRWRNGKGYKGSTKFYNAIKKYGWNSFEHEIIPAFPEELDFLETEFIKKFDTVKNGYNLCGGGNGRGLISEETRKKLSESHKGLPKKGGYAWGDKNCPVYKAYGNEYHNHKIFCIELNKEFKSIKEAETYLNISNISAVCRGKQKTAGGYHWRYAE